MLLAWWVLCRCPQWEESPFHQITHILLCHRITTTVHVCLSTDYGCPSRTHAWKQLASQRTRFAHCFIFSVPLLVVPSVQARTLQSMIFRHVRKLGKSDYGLRHVCPHETARLPPGRFFIKYDFWVSRKCVILGKLYVAIHNCVTWGVFNDYIMNNYMFRPVLAIFRLS